MSDNKSTGRKPGHNASSKGFVSSPPVVPTAPTVNRAQRRPGVEREVVLPTPETYVKFERAMFLKNISRVLSVFGEKVNFQYETNQELANKSQEGKENNRQEIMTQWLQKVQTLTLEEIQEISTQIRTEWNLGAWWSTLDKSADYNANHTTELFRDKANNIASWLEQVKTLTPDEIQEVLSKVRLEWNMGYWWRGLTNLDDREVFKYTVKSLLSGFGEKVRFEDERENQPRRTTEEKKILMDKVTAYADVIREDLKDK